MSADDEAQQWYSGHGYYEQPYLQVETMKKSGRRRGARQTNAAASRVKSQPPTKQPQSPRRQGHSKPRSVAELTEEEHQAIKLGWRERQRKRRERLKLLQYGIQLI